MAERKRLLWIDIAKALAICWVVYFHFLRTVFEHYELPPLDWHAPMSILRALWWQVSGLGFHAVGAFIVLSGFTLMQSTARRAESGEIAWGKWYFDRLVRLYPMYWVAHLVYLLSPCVARLEPVDERIVLSLLGLRFINIEMNFMYLNAAWWYFAMLMQFYAIFPLLFFAARKCGPLVFLLGACALGFLTRHLMLNVYPQHGLWILGGFAVCRLPELAFGMALAMWYARSISTFEKFLVRGPVFLAGLILYPFALKTYANGIAYVFADFATGASCFLVIVGIAGAISIFNAPAKLFALIGTYSYGLYLIHQPYVIWLGLKIRPQPIGMFLVIFVVVLALLSTWGTILERSTNALVDRLVRPKPRSPAAKMLV